MFIAYVQVDDLIHHHHNHNHNHNHNQYHHQYIIISTMYTIMIMIAIPQVQELIKANIQRSKVIQDQVSSS